MRSLSEILLEAIKSGMTYLASDNIRGDVWKVAVYVKSNKEDKQLNELATKGGSRRFNLELYSEGKEQIEGCELLTLAEFEEQLKSGKLQ